MTNESLQFIGIIISALSALAASISAIYSAKSANTTISLYKQEKKERLIDKLNRILEIGIEHPYLESKHFTSKWNYHKETDDERYLRYDMYCNLIFNYLNNVYEHFEFDKNKVEEFVDIKTWVRLHKNNWLNPIDENENIDGYDAAFKTFINSYIK